LKVLFPSVFVMMLFQGLMSADSNYINSVNGLCFPSNGDQPSRTFVAFQYENPNLDGLPIWGQNRGGATYLWQYKPFQQNGYYVTFWWSENSDLFTWDSGNSNSYYGGHPYPEGGSSASTHNWELAGMDSGADNLNTIFGSPLKVIKDVWYTQALVININDDGTKTARFYIDLPNLDDNRIIEVTASAGWGEKNPPHPAITFGDSPWWYSYQNERLSGILGPIKIFNKSLAEGDLLKEAQDMSGLKTVNGKNNIWWGKNSFETVNDLVCDYGTERTFQWANENKASLIELERNVDFDSVHIGDTNNISLPIYSSKEDITVSDISMSSGIHFDVSSDQLPATLSKGDSLIVQLKFEPQSLGRHQDTLIIKSSSSNLAHINSSGIGVDQVSAIEEDKNNTSKIFKLEQNYPNPFNPTTTIEYFLSAAADVELTIFNMLGQPVKSLVQQKQKAGNYNVQWDATNNNSIAVPGGLYIYKIRAGSYSKLNKMILVK
jgi:hypothetical protein